MKTACTNCPCDAIGTESASLCVDCGTTAVAGASLNTPLALAAVAGVLLAGFAWSWLRKVRVSAPAPALA